MALANTDGEYIMDEDDYKTFIETGKVTIYIKEGALTIRRG